MGGCDFKASCRPYFGQQIRMAVQHLEQFHQRQGWFGLAVLVTRERIDAAENFRRFPLIKIEFLADIGNEGQLLERHNNYVIDNRQLQIDIDFGGAPGQQSLAV